MATLTKSERTRARILDAAARRERAAGSAVPLERRSVVMAAIHTALTRRSA